MHLTGVFGGALRHTRRRLAAALVAIAAATGLAGCGWLGQSGVPALKPSAFILRGQATVAEPASTTGNPGTACTAPASAGGLGSGTVVTVADPAGRTLGGGYLDPGVLAAGPAGPVCAFGFQIPGITGGVAAYTVTVGSLASRSFTAAQLRQGGLALLVIPPIAAPAD